jgi:polyisoprenoid-binding protein YceI
MLKIFNKNQTILVLLFTIFFIVSCGNSEENLVNENENKPETIIDTSVTNSTSTPSMLPSPTTEAKNKSIDEKKEPPLSNDEGNLIQIDFNSDSDNYIRANYRVTEQLAKLSYPIDAVGYTQEISGSIYIDKNGKPTSESLIHINLSSIKSDESRRDDYLSENSLETNKFPDAYFLVKDLKNLNISDLTSFTQNEIKFQMVGDLTIHGVTKSKTWDVEAKTELGSIKGNASISFPFSDFDMNIPNLFFIISVEDNITLELDFDISVSLDASTLINGLSLLNKTSLPEFSQQEIQNNNSNALYTNAWLCTGDKEERFDDLSTSSEEMWKCFVEIEMTDDSVIVTSTGIPNHDFESKLGCCAEENDYQWIIPTSPKFSEKIIMAPDRGAIAITVTGVPIFGPEEGPGGDAVALHFDYFEEDRQEIQLGLCGGHSAGSYFHYHFDANCLHWHPEGEGLDWEDWDYTKNLDPDEHSPVIGFAFDGFPIYGPYGWDSYKNVIEITSSYRLKKGADGYNGIDDWEFVEGLGDTDECNGLSSSTPEVPDGIYHYVSTIRNGNDQIGFPYFLLCYHGIPNESNYEEIIDGQGPGAGGPGREGPGQGGPGRTPPDLTSIAKTLGISIEELVAALGGPPPNYESAAQALGISVEELLKLLPKPPAP